MLVFVHIYKMNTFFEYFESLPAGFNISIKWLYTAVIVAEPSVHCALSMACVLQCGQHRAHRAVATPIPHMWIIQHLLLSPC
jgi:hypothetical protein